VASKREKQVKFHKGIVEQMS